MDLLVVGAGAVGRWFAEAIDARPAFADVDPEAASDAAAAVGGRAVPLEGDERFDAVCVAVPIPAAATAIEEQADRADQAVLDVTGVMEPAVAAMRSAAPDAERASLHPLFAPDKAPGNVAAVIDDAGPVTADVVDALEARGNDVFETTPTEHDRAMETIQAKAHVAVLAYAMAADDVPAQFHTPVSGTLAELAETVTDGDASVYADVQAAFGGADDVARAAELLADADPDLFATLHREAGEGPMGDD